MPLNRPLPAGLLLATLLAACAPSTSAPAANGPGPANPSQQAAGAGGQAPAAGVSPTPSPSPYVTVIPSPVYQESGLNVAVGDYRYAKVGEVGNIVHSKATMTVQVKAAKPVALELEEYNAPDNDQGDKTYDFVTIKDTAASNVHSFGADQGFTSFWADDQAAAAPAGYRVLQARATTQAGLWVQWVGEQTYFIADRPEARPIVAYSVEAAARELLRTDNGQPVWPQVHDASLASLTGLYAIVRDRQAGAPPAFSLQALDRHQRGLPPEGFRGGGNGPRWFRVLAEDPQALNPAAALLREVIRLRNERAGNPPG